MCVCLLFRFVCLYVLFVFVVFYRYLEVLKLEDVGTIIVGWPGYISPWENVKN